MIIIRLKYLTVCGKSFSLKFKVPTNFSLCTYNLHFSAINIWDGRDGYGLVRSRIEHCFLHKSS